MISKPVLRWFTRVRVVLLAMLCWVSASGLAPRAAHAFTAVTSCGTTITTPGVYALTANIGPCAGDGIVIAAHDVLLFCTAGCHITGSNAAGSVGVRIKSNSRNAIVQFLTITHFDTGIEDDANNALINDFDSTLNKTGVLVKHVGGTTVVDFDTDDNSVNGVVVDHANNTELKDFDADSAGAGGIVLDHSNNAELFDFSADHDGGPGVLLDHSNKALLVDFDTRSSSGDSGTILDHSSNNVLHDFGAGSNHKFGVWVNGSSNNVIDDFNANSNVLTGVFLGCSATGPTGVKCTGPNSNRNVVSDAEVDTNGNNGVAIDLGDTKNTVTDVFGAGNTGHDGLDKNTNCDTNSWTNDVFTAADPSCVH